MTSVRKYCKYLLFFFFLFGLPVHAQVVINEYSSGSTSDWVELINIATVSADLSVYTLRDSAEHSAPALAGSLEPGAMRSFPISNYLNNSGDTVRLMHTENGLESEVDRSSYGEAGGVCSATDTQTIGRKPDGTGLFIRFESSSRDTSNNSSTEAPCPTDTPTKTLTPTKTPTVTKSPTSPPVATATHTPMPTNTQTPPQETQPSVTTKPTSLRTPTPKKTPTPMTKPGETESGLSVLGESTGSSVPTATPPTGANSSPSYTPLIITFLLVGIGLGIIAAVLAWQKHQEMKHHRTEEKEGAST